MRPSVQPFLWKWVLFAWEWKIISISKAEHLLPRFDTEAREDSETAYCVEWIRVLSVSTLIEIDLKIIFGDMLDMKQALQSCHFEFLQRG